MSHRIPPSTPSSTPRTDSLHSTPATTPRNVPLSPIDSHDFTQRTVAPSIKAPSKGEDAMDALFAPREKTAVAAAPVALPAKAIVSSGQIAELKERVKTLPAGSFQTLVQSLGRDELNKAIEGAAEDTKVKIVQALTLKQLAEQSDYFKEVPEVQSALLQEQHRRSSSTGPATKYTYEDILWMTDAWQSLIPKDVSGQKSSFEGRLPNGTPITVHRFMANDRGKALYNAQKEVGDHIGFLEDATKRQFALVFAAGVAPPAASKTSS